MRVLLIALLCIALQNVASAEGIDKAGVLLDRSWAIDFKVTSNFSLSAPKDRAFLIKHHLSQKIAIRGGIDVFKSRTELDFLATYPDTIIGQVPRRW